MCNFMYTKDMYNARRGSIIDQALSRYISTIHDDSFSTERNTNGKKTSPPLSLYLNFAFHFESFGRINEVVYPVIQ